MKKHKRSSRKRRPKRKVSKITLIILTILGIVLLGDIIGAIMYLRQSPEVQANLMQYMATGNALSFFQIFWRQFLYQLTIWMMGVTIIGNIVNLFLIFARGVSAGFNLAILVGEVEGSAGTGTIFLWLIQYILILFTTILSVYFSIRFAYLMTKSLVMKKYKLIKKHLKLYVTQFAVVIMLTIFTSMLSAVTTPVIQSRMIEGYTVVDHSY